MFANKNLDGSFASRLTFIGGRPSTKGSHKLSLANKRRLKEKDIDVNTAYNCGNLILIDLEAIFTLFGDYLESGRIKRKKDYEPKIRNCLLTSLMIFYQQQIFHSFRKRVKDED